MRLAVWLKKELPFSLRLYAVQVLSQFDILNVDYTVFDDFNLIEDQVFDLIWHPTLAGLWFPEYELYLRKEKIVATCHGVRPYIIPDDPKIDEDHKAYLNINRSATKVEWSKFKWRINRVIAVSDLAKKEISSVYDLPKDMIDVIHHGVNKSSFFPRETKTKPPFPYFLSVSQYQYVKNIDRLVEAFVMADLDDVYKLYLHLPNYEETIDAKNVILRTEPIGEEELAELYRDAYAFAFPTMHESFGLPVMEAMASGCPVITSKGTGTEEISGDAAILVDPYNVTEISEAIMSLVNDKTLYQDLVVKGLKRSRQFDWRTSAKLHLETFAKVLD